MLWNTVHLMSPHMVIRCLIASGVGLLLMSCSTTRTMSPDPSSSAALSRYILVIEEKPVGQVSHTWEPLSDAEASKYLRHAPQGALRRTYRPCCLHPRL